MRRPTDVLAVISGLILSVVALSCLWVSLRGAVNWDLAKVAAPISLVVIGIIGVVLSQRNQNRSQ